MHHRILFLLALLSLATTSMLRAQESVASDTLRVHKSIISEESNTSLKKEEIKTPKASQAKVFNPNPTKAVLFSIIPGGGQVYNRVYWKLPIVVGAYTACYYAISWNNNNLTEYANAFRDIKSDNPMEHTSWQDFLPYGASPESYINNTSFHEQLRRGRDFYRRNRDLSIIISVGVYALLMIDAYVDAELYSFDISPNLTLSYAPAYMPPSVETPERGIGIQLALTF